MIAHYEVTDALQRHFECSDEYLNVQQLSEMTNLDTTEVENTLRVLHEQGLIMGTRPAGSPYPTEVTASVKLARRLKAIAAQVSLPGRNTPPGQAERVLGAVVLRL